jgi:hypothetical protein
MKIPQQLLFSALFVLCNSSFAQFQGELILQPAGCDQQGLCTLKNDLRYTDPKGLVWQAAAGLKTDGASIPPVFQPIVGAAFKEQFIKAAVIHDHYCIRQVRTWMQTHRVFYDALLESGVPKVKAKLMYYAVLLGGPKWADLMPGKNCVGNCINSITTKNNRPVKQTRKADYELFDMQKELRQLETILTVNPDALTDEQLIARALERRPGDEFLTYRDKIPFDPTR